jgi:hypothetical protein
MDLYLFLFWCSIIICVFASAIYAVASARIDKLRDQREELEYIQTVQREQRLPSVASGLMLMKGETAFYSEPAAYQLPRPVRRHATIGIGGRLCGGIFAGGAVGKSESELEWKQVDTGRLVVTNKNIIFLGRNQVVITPVNSVLSASIIPGGIEILQTSQRASKNAIYSARQPGKLSFIIQVCNLAKNPQRLENIDLEIVGHEHSKYETGL